MPLGVLLAGRGMFLFTLFPYVSLVPLPTDTQPYAFVFSVLTFLLGRRVALPVPIWGLFVLFAAAVVLFLGTGATLNGLRALSGYAGIFLISASVVILAESGVRLTDRMLDTAVYTWAFVALAQMFVSPNFMTFLVAASRSTSLRGVPSLAVEPSAYATVMIFFLVFYFLRGRERSWPAILCIFQTALLAQSALGLLFLLLALAFYTFLRLSAPVAILTLGGLGGCFYLLMTFAESLLAGTRIGGLLAIAMNSPGEVLLLDASVAVRLASIFYSLKGAFENWLLPHGFDAWSAFADMQDQVFRDVFIYRGQIGGRIMSGYGAILYELGALALIIPSVVTVGIFRAYGMKKWGHTLALTLFIHLLMVTPVPISLPLVGVLIGELYSGRPSGSRKMMPLETPRLGLLQSA